MFIRQNKYHLSCKFIPRLGYIGWWDKWRKDELGKEDRKDPEGGQKEDQRSKEDWRRIVFKEVGGEKKSRSERGSMDGIEEDKIIGRRNKLKWMEIWKEDGSIEEGRKEWMDGWWWRDIRMNLGRYDRRMGWWNDEYREGGKKDRRKLRGKKDRRRKDRIRKGGLKERG